MINEKIKAHLETHPTIYVSITGLKVKNFWKFFLFLRFAVPAKIQADKAEGSLYVGVKKINGIEHTLTVWTSKDSMKRYLSSGAHLRALKNFRRVASGKTFGYESSTVPEWSEVHDLWLEKGKEY